MNPSLDTLPKIGAPATRALNMAGYTTLRQLAGVPRARLAELHGMGPAVLGIIEAALEHQLRDLLVGEDCVSLPSAFVTHFRGK